MCGRQEAQRGKSTWEPGDPKFKRHFASVTKFLPLSKPQVLRLIKWENTSCRARFLQL